MSNNKNVVNFFFAIYFSLKIGPFRAKEIKKTVELTSLQPRQAKKIDPDDEKSLILSNFLDLQFFFLILQ